MFEDKILVCRDCGAEFVFSAGEQQFYAEKGFQNEPVRCKACRDAKKAARGEHTDRGEREMYDAVCAACGAPPRFLSSPRTTSPCTARLALWLAGK